MIYKIESEQFSGPLDLLLQLIEAQELDITKISLAQVTDEYLKYIESAEQINPEEMADFLVVAAKLILIKSKALLPGLELEEEGDLEIQLKLYKEFLEVSKVIHKMILKRKFSYSREKLPQGIEPEFSPPQKLTTQKLARSFKQVLDRLEPIVRLPENTIKRVINIEEKIKYIREYITKKIQTTFYELVGQGDKAEAIVNFLALLELVKQRVVNTEQQDLFGDISIKKI